MTHSDGDIQNWETGGASEASAGGRRDAGEQSSRPGPPPNADASDDHVRRRAYELYLERGGAPGDDVTDWLTAEREVRARDAGGAARPVDLPSDAVVESAVTETDRPAETRSASATRSTRRKAAANPDVAPTDETPRPSRGRRKST